MQLNVLGKSKYIQSVIQVAQEECERERLRDALSLSNLFWGSFADEQADDTIPHEPIDEEVERKYLTLSWWILHVGWKDVGERVRRAVEEVFEGCGLAWDVAMILWANKSLLMQGLAQDETVGQSSSHPRG